MTDTPSKPGEQANDSAYDLFILGVAAYSIVLLVALLFPLQPSIRQVLILLDDWLSLIYLFDFLRSFARAPRKLAYLKWGWLDLLAAVPVAPFTLPSYLHFIRLLRLARVVIIVRKIRARDLWRQVARRRAESTFLSVAFLAMVFIGVASVAILLTERGASQANIVTGSDALWWVMTTVTTVERVFLPSVAPVVQTVYLHSSPARSASVHSLTPSLDARPALRPLTNTTPAVFPRYSLAPSQQLQLLPNDEMPVVVRAAAPMILAAMTNRRIPASKHLIRPLIRSFALGASGAWQH
jgi:hypothetical protein